MRYFIGILLICSTIAVSTTAHAIDPDAITDDERTMIVSSCRNAQSRMQRLQYVDSIARVNRGNAYANITKLMEALGSRTAYNSYSVPVVVSATNSAHALREEFSDAFTDYEIALRDLITFDCVGKPVDFYKRLTTVRAKRALVAAKIDAITAQLDVFSRGMIDLQTQMRGRLQ